MSVKLDDLDLSRKNGSSSAGTGELRIVNDIALLDKRSIVEIEIPERAGNILQDMGREPAVVIIHGEIMGKNAKSIVESLMLKADENKPCQLLTDMLHGLDVDKVLIENLSLQEREGGVDRYGYRLVLKEVKS